jgi:hypothetical protein
MSGALKEERKSTSGGGKAMAALAKDQSGFYHPTSEDEICQLVQRAGREGVPIRVRGAAHSLRQAIYTHPDPATSHGINLMLDQYAHIVAFDDVNRRVTVQAGCHLGHDPYDPTGTSTLANSLVYQLHQRGWALPHTGGIIQQTVAGFAATGSSGGSVRHAVHESIVAMRLIDGRGVPHDVTPETAADIFFAAGVSMGLLGIVSTVTLQCLPAYHIIGQEVTTDVDDCERDCGIDLFGASPRRLETFLQQTEYARLLWWPQPGVKKITVWQARRMQADDYNADTGTPATFQRRPYKIPSHAQQVIGNLFLKLYGTWPEWFRTLSARYGGLRLFEKIIDGLWEPVIVPIVLNLSVEDGTQRFWDTWWQGLPMDNDIDYTLLPTDFMEFWLPLSKTQEVVTRLRDYFDQEGLDATRAYAFEIYAAKRSPFWLSPAYESDMVRVDFLWFKGNTGNPVVDYFPQFWQLLRDLGFRLHWGKYLLEDPAYLQAQYPQWQRFMQVRAAMDPQQVFVSDYWRRHLGIQRP